MPSDRTILDGVEHIVLPTSLMLLPTPWQLDDPHRAVPGNRSNIFMTDADKYTYVADLAAELASVLSGGSPRGVAQPQSGGDSPPPPKPPVNN